MIQLAFIQSFERKSTDCGHTPTSRMQQPESTFPPSLIQINMCNEKRFIVLTDEEQLSQALVHRVTGKTSGPLRTPDNGR